MLDTAVKDGVSTLDLLGEEGVAAFVEEARSLGLETAVAGSLRAGELSRLAGLGAGILGVRGSACDGGRAGRVTATRVRALRAALGVGPGARSSGGLAPR